MGYRLSVIVPAYNSINTLPETLNCLLGQSLYEDMQIIVVNDGSTDGTADLVKEYQKKHTNIVFIDKENGGVSSARNAGIEAATGKYIVFCDADDLIGKDSAEAIVNEMDRNNADAGIFRVARFGFGGYEFNPIVDSLVSEKKIPCFDKRLLWTFLVGNKCYRTDLVKEHGICFPDTCYSEDGVFWMSFIMKNSPNIIGIRTASSLYRRFNPDVKKSVTQTLTMKTVSDFCRSMKLIDEAISANFASDGCKCEDKIEYIQEFTYKKCYTILNEFYRQIWSSDNETMAFIESEYNSLLNSLDETKRKKLHNSFRELWPPVFSTTKLSENPMINVRVKKPAPEFLNSMYRQTMPGFRLVTDNAGEYSAFGNTGHESKQGVSVKFFGKHAIDPRILRIIYLNKSSGKISFLPCCIIKHISFLYIRIKDKKQRVLN